jgi:integrase/recombinase XerD
MRDGMHETVVSFRNHLEELGRSPNTIRQYTWHAQRLVDYLGEDPADITREDLSRYRHYLANKCDYTKTSLYMVTMAIKGFFSFLEMDTADTLPRPSRRKSLPKYLTEAEAHNLLMAAEHDPRDHAILTVMAYTGLRVSEVCHLDCEHISLGERTLSVVSGKGDKDRMVVFAQPTAVALRRWLEARDEVDTDALFLNRNGTRLSPRSIQRIVKAYAEDAGIRKVVTPHVLRHTMATTLLRHGADIRIIQQLLGHSSIATTQIYTHVDDQMLRTAYDKASPEY